MSNIYSAPGADMSANINNDETYTPELFSLKGRIGRCRMLAYPVALFFAFVAVLIVLAIVGMRDMESMMMKIVVGLLYIPMVVFSLAFTVRRLHDLDQTGWLSLLTFVPIVNFFFFLYLWIAPGTQGGNSYGPPPGPNSGWVIAGALVVPVLFVLGIVAAIALPSLMTNYRPSTSQSSGRF